MNRALVIGSIPFCYQSQAKFLSGILGLNNFDITHFTTASGHNLISGHYQFIYSNSIFNIIHLCKKLTITADLICCPAVYSKNTCPVNDLNNIEFIEKSDVEDILYTISKRVLFLSEHDSTTSINFIIT